MDSGLIAFIIAVAAISVLAYIAAGYVENPVARPEILYMNGTELSVLNNSSITIKAGELLLKLNDKTTVVNAEDIPPGGIVNIAFEAANISSVSVLYKGTVNNVKVADIDALLKENYNSDTNYPATTTSTTPKFTTTTTTVKKTTTTKPPAYSGGSSTGGSSSGGSSMNTETVTTTLQSSSTTTILAPAMLCSDSDGGQNIYQKGTTAGPSESDTDTCSSPSRLLEWHCLAGYNQPLGYYIDCPAGYSCQNGACIATASVTTTTLVPTSTTTTTLGVAATTTTTTLPATTTTSTTTTTIPATTTTTSTTTTMPLSPDSPDSIVQPILFMSSDYPVDDQLTQWFSQKISEIKTFYANNNGGKTFKTLPLAVVQGDHDHEWYWCTNSGGQCNQREGNLINELKAKGYPVDPDWNNFPSNRVVWILDMGGGGYAGARKYPTGGGIAIVGDASVYAFIDGNCNRVKDKYFPNDNHPNVKDTCQNSWIPSGQTQGFSVGALAHELGHAFGMPHPDGYGYPTSSVKWSQTMIGWHWLYPATGLLNEDRNILSTSNFFG